MGIGKFRSLMGTLGSNVNHMNYQAIYESMVVKPTSVDRLAQDKLVSDLESVWSKISVLDMFTVHTNLSGEALINWKSPGIKNPSIIGTPAFKKHEGFFSADASYIKTNYIPSEDGNVGQNNICILVGNGSQIINPQAVVGASGVSGLHQLTIHPVASNQAYFRCNASGLFSSPNSDPVKHYAMSRNNSLNFDTYLNKTKTNKTSTSTGLTDKEVYGLGYNLNDTAAICINSNLKYLLIASFLTESEIALIIDAIELYFTSCSRGQLINYGGLPVNEPSKAILPLTTYDGSGQTVHPSVISTGLWNGYKYWMANTPYPSSDSAYENPSIWGSNDGLTWAVPSGITNPVIAKPVNGFNADPDLFFEGDKLHMVFKETTLDGSVIKYTSFDGTSWTTPVVVLTPIADEKVCVSPSIVKIGGVYFIYYSTYEGELPTTNPRVRRVSCSTINGTYGGHELINAPVVGLGRIWWHLSVKLINNKFWLSSVDASTSGPSDNIFILQSVDGVNFTKYIYPVVRKSGLNHSFYRASLEIIEGQPILYFSTYLSGIWGLGKQNVTLF